MNAGVEELQVPNASWMSTGDFPPEMIDTMSIDTAPGRAESGVRFPAAAQLERWLAETKPRLKVIK